MNPLHYSDSRTFLIYIDSWDHDVPVGRFCNQELAESGTFQSMTQLLFLIDGCLDLEDTPQSFQVRRSFHPHSPLPPSTAPPVQNTTGKAATFVLRIHFRQHASWQGTLHWLEGHRTMRFRSVLELIHLLSSTAPAPPFSHPADA